MKNPPAVRTAIVETFGVVIDATVDEYITLCEKEGNLKLIRKLLASHGIKSGDCQQIRAFAHELSASKKEIARIHEGVVKVLLDAQFDKALYASLISDASVGNLIQHERLLLACRMSSLNQSICGVQINGINNQIKRHFAMMNTKASLDLGSGLITRSLIETFVRALTSGRPNGISSLCFTVLHAENLNRAFMFLSSELEDEEYLNRHMHNVTKTNSGFMDTIPVQWENKKA